MNEGEKKKEKNQSMQNKQKAHNRMVDLNSSRSIITLNIIRLHIPIKR